MVTPGNRREYELKALCPGALAGTDAPRAVSRVAAYQLHISLFVAGSIPACRPADK
jgi:hypothetical protein